MPIWIVAKKDLRLLLRDTRAAIILMAMPVVFILVLGMALGESFGQKPDDRLRISIVDEDAGLPDKPWYWMRWSLVVREGDRDEDRPGNWVLRQHADGRLRVFGADLAVVIADGGDALAHLATRFAENAARTARA